MSSQDTTTYNTKQYYSYTDLKRKLNIFNGGNNWEIVQIIQTS